MTAFERAYVCLEPFLPPLYGQIRRELLAAARRSAAKSIDLLDVGGRKSHYTVAVPGDLTITDVPRENHVQHALDLGLTQQMIAQLKRRRSNLKNVLFDDMTRSVLPSASFDVVVAVEVLEHVEDDVAFLREVARVLRGGGTFIMSTPNGDAIPHPHNADHKRHYPAESLRQLLQRYFATVHVRYAVVNSVFRRAGLQPWSVRRPLRTAWSMFGNLVSNFESGATSSRFEPLRTRHLVAVCRAFA